MSMSDGLQRYLGVASGLTRTTLGATERAVAQFVRQGEIAADHVERLLDEVIARSVESSGALAQLVRAEVERAIGRAGFVRAADLDALRAEVAALRLEAAARNGAPPAAGPSNAGDRPDARDLSDRGGS
jgi:polyhydroxyalkanoate synthesis regulator phasin